MLRKDQDRQSGAMSAGERLTIVVLQSAGSGCFLAPFFSHFISAACFHPGEGMILPGNFVN
jgi:hypothetical protein